MNNLRYKLYGKIPRNFLVNISGLIGDLTGIFKSSMGLQIAYSIDPLFNLKQRVGFSVNELMDKIRDNTEFDFCDKCLIEFQKTYLGSYELNESEESKCHNCEGFGNHLVLLTRLVFFLDEQTKTLRTGGLVRLQNLVDTVRQRQLCFICCGVDTYGFDFTTYHLKRIQESSDDYLPKKRVLYSVYDDKRDLYYGSFKWNIIPLSDPRWNQIWDEYSKMKTKFQRIAISQQLSGMDYEEYAEGIINHGDFQKCVKNGKVINKLLKLLIMKTYPDFTFSEREMVLAQVRMMVDE